MEALRTMIESLLTAENRKLCKEKLGTSEQIDREAELKRAEINIAELADHVRVLEQR